MRRWLFIFPFHFSLSTLASACTVCFGGADDNLIKGFTWGVAILGSLPFALLAGLVILVIRSSKKQNVHE